MLEIGADFDQSLHAQRQEVTVLVERKLCFGDVIARLRVAQEGFGTGADPLHGPADEFGGEQNQRRFVEDRRLHTEAAAGVARDDTNLALWDLEYLGELGTGRMRTLYRRVNGVAPIGGVVVTDSAPRLHGGGRDSVDHEAMLHHARRAREGRIGCSLIADHLDKAYIVRAGLPYPWSARPRRFGSGCDG